MRVKRLYFEANFYLLIVELWELTEQAKIVSREEKNKEGPIKERASWFFICGLIVSLIGYIVYDFHVNSYYITQTGREILLNSEYPYQFVGLLLIIFGIVSISIGLGTKIYSRVWNHRIIKIPSIVNDIRQNIKKIYFDLFTQLKNET